MIKAICYKDVRPGDVVCQSTDERFTISAVGNGPELLGFVDNGQIYFSIEGSPCLYLSGFPDQLIGLIHRPWPQGRTVLEMLGEIARLGLGMQPLYHLGATTSLEQAVTNLRETIEVFELGFPPTDGE